MEQVDTLIKAGWIITVDSDFSILENHSIAIKDGLITAIFDSATTSPCSAKHIIDLSQHLLMPGLVNAHGHAAMSLFRGLADDFELMTWLQHYIWPAEQKFVDAKFVEEGTTLAIAEMIRSGTTCFSDMYFFPEVAAKVAEHVGIRAQLAFPLFDMPSNWGAGVEEYLQKGTQMMEQFKDSVLVQIAFGPHAPYTLSDESLQKIAALTNKYPANIQMHLHETTFEVETAITDKGQRPMQRIAASGLINQRFQAVHMTTLNDEDIEILVKTGAHIIHCPESNLKLASGFCPVQKCIDAGINVALGTDGAASNNDLDMFSEMRTAAMLAKAVSGDATAVNANQAIRMATINGAKALGIDHITGSIEPGKSADIIALDFSGIEQHPLYHPASQVVYTNVANKVSHSWVMGKPLLTDYQLTTINSAECIVKAKYWQQQLQTLSNQ